MSKVMAFRFEPSMGHLIETVAKNLTNIEVRPVSKTEAVQRAVVVLHSLLTSGNIRILEKPEVKSLYRRTLAEVQGLSLEGNNNANKGREG